MKKILKLGINLILLIVFIGTGIEKAQAMDSNAIKTERKQANAIDAMLATITTKAINDYLLQNPDKLSLLTSAGIGAGSWLTGELAETIYKEIYKKITGKNLRDSLGKFTIFNIDIDKQRLLRRIITFIPICVSLYLINK